MAVEDQAGVLADVTKILGDHDISIESILQKGTGSHEDVLPVVIVTHKTLEQNMQLAVEQLESLSSVKRQHHPYSY